MARSHKGILNSIWTKVNGASMHARDPIVRQEWTEQVHRLLPESQLVVVRGSGHAVNFNAPEKLVRTVQSFLSQ